MQHLLLPGAVMSFRKLEHRAAAVEACRTEGRAAAAAGQRGAVEIAVRAEGERRVRHAAVAFARLRIEFVQDLLAPLPAAGGRQLIDDAASGAAPLGGAEQVAVRIRNRRGPGFGPVGELESVDRLERPAATVADHLEDRAASVVAAGRRGAA